jgi:nitrate reductase beta subunit
MTPMAVENFQMLKVRQTSDTLVSGEEKKGRVNLLNWDGKGAPDGLFPKARPTEPEDSGPDPTAEATEGEP